MKLLICLITHNRLAYTKRTLRSLWSSTSDGREYNLIIVDNASNDGSQKYISNLYDRGRIDEFILNSENLYPGKACNLGWEKGMKFNPTHLMRLDNDMMLNKDWDLRVEECFETIPELGQLGIEHEAIEHPKADLYRRQINGLTINEWPGVVGGPMIMPRKLWDLGVRYEELRWDDGRKSALQEDSKLSMRIKEMGFIVGHAQEELARTFATKQTWKDYPDYYRKTMTERGYTEVLGEIDGPA